MIKSSQAKFLLFPLFIFISYSLFASELYKFVAWKPIEDASGYQIQIKDKQGKIIIDKKIEKNYFSVQDLAVGDYFVRSAPLNLFKKPVVWSEWKEMEILISEIPTVEKKENDKPAISLKKPEPSVENKSTVSELEIEGDNFLDVTEVEIKQQETKLPILEKQFKNERRIDVKVDTAKASPGDYDLTIVNPFQKPQVVSKFLKIEETPPAKTVVEVPKGKQLHQFTYEEYMSYLEENKVKDCDMTKIPGPTLGGCYKSYVTINQSTKETRDMYAFFRLISENQNDRFFGYSYFETKCKPVFLPAKQRMTDLLNKKRSSLDSEETAKLEKAVKKLATCSE
ncbi:hypothetical protein [Leptospira idonii]|uniref:Uncharacterized protein n=1 Tax=Leptospira idonii TaxID=1193500 RepID=A0A4R9M0W3_9LEPT|nr:hypothetical protein [Leptospira idonii]TGN19445.1 hypothetical protein EHS15_08895 [Leptospira idonii]